VDVLEEKRVAIIASDRRWRLRFAILAVVVPLALFGLFRRHELRLRALADHGRAATAVVTATTRSQGATYTEYRYEVGGVSYSWSVSYRDAPYPAGATLGITYLPEDPSLSQPGAYTRAHLDADLDLPFQRRIIGGLFAFFALASGLCHRQLRKLEAGRPMRTEPRVSPDRLGQIMAVVFGVITVGTTFDPAAQKVFVAGFGEAPLGIPVKIVVAVALVILGLPSFWVLPHLMRILVAWQRRGGAMTKFHVAEAIVRAEPELRTSRAIVIGGLVYFFALMAAWIAFTASRGI
jgi:hypothetical protein